MREVNEMLYSYLVGGRNYTHQPTFDSCSRCDQSGELCISVYQPRRMTYQERLQSCRMGDRHCACATVMDKMQAAGGQRNESLKCPSPVYSFSRHGSKRRYCKRRTSAVKQLTCAKILEEMARQAGVQ
jgi:hypothetical protein